MQYLIVFIDLKRISVLFTLKNLKEVITIIITNYILSCYLQLYKLLNTQLNFNLNFVSYLF